MVLGKLLFSFLFLLGLTRAVDVDVSVRQDPPFEVFTCPSVTISAGQELLPSVDLTLAPIFFGQYVKRDGNWLVVGGYGLDRYRGGGFVYELVGGAWSHKQTLTLKMPSNGDYFGLNLAISGTTICIGAPFDEPYGKNSGSAHVFDLVGGSWTETQEIIAPGNGYGHNGAYNGYAIGLDNDILAVGSRNQNEVDENGNTGQLRVGAVYVYSRTGALQPFNLVQILAGPAPAQQWGDEVRVLNTASEKRILVGSPRHRPKQFGAAYVFNLVNGVWTQHQVLVPDEAGAGATVDPTNRPHFGEGIYQTETTIGVGGERGASDKTSRSGSAYIYEKDANGFWTQMAPLFPDKAQAMFLGQRIGGENSNFAVAGAWQARESGIGKTGAWFYYVKCSDGSWSRGARMLNPTRPGMLNDDFGKMMDVSGGVISVGAPKVDSGNNNRGAVYTYFYSLGAGVPAVNNMDWFGDAPSLLGACNPQNFSCGNIYYASTQAMTIRCTLRRNNTLLKAKLGPVLAAGVGNIDTIEVKTPAGIVVGEQLEIRLEMRQPDGRAPLLKRRSTFVTVTECA